MTENIKRIFDENIVLLGETDKAIQYFREQQYDKALSTLAHSMDQVKTIVEAIITDRSYFNLVETDAVIDMLQRILEAKKNRDYVLLADLLELQLGSFLNSVQELIIRKEEILFDEEHYSGNVKLVTEIEPILLKQLEKPINPGQLLEDGYRVEFTSCGLMTLAAENAGAKFYFHTNNHIISEAFSLARRWYQPGVKRYVIYGFAMGYHIRELLTIAPEAFIEVYETDANVIQLACAFTNVKELFNEDKVTLIYDPNCERLKKRIAVLTDEENLVIHYPSYQNMRCPEGRDILEMFVPWSKTIESC
ncbi:MAG: hypothetical protein K0S47_802 [Herbinix sp.]|nr:hypothetical protein [Herbinix sp.]